MAIIFNERAKAQLASWDILINISKWMEEEEMKYKELELAFKAIHDEYVASDAFVKWAAAKKAWEETETYKTDPERYMGDPLLAGRARLNPILFPEKIHDIVPRYSTEEEDHMVYCKFKWLSKSSETSYGGDFICPGFSKPQERFDLKRKLLLLEYGLPSDTKLPSEWYLGGYEWDWS